MKIGFQHMGNVCIPLRAFIGSLGAEVVLGPRPNRRGREIGARLAPESVCLPFKVTLGDMVQCLELGADTLAFLGSGDWSCRFGYYGRIQCEILRAHGYSFRPLFISGQTLRDVIKELPGLNRGSWTRSCINTLRGLRLACRKSRLVEKVESLARRLRPIEQTHGSTTRLMREFLDRIDSALTIMDVNTIAAEIDPAFSRLPRQNLSPHRILLIGESYCVIEPLVNFDLIEYAAGMGVVIEPFLTAHQWLFRHALRLESGTLVPKKKAIRLARPLWAYGTGGEDQVGIGTAIHAVRTGIQGIIHLMPFGCMPETSALPVIQAVCAQKGIPLLHQSLDEHSSPAGFHTRVEAFVDLVTHRSTKSRTHRSQGDGHGFISGS